MTNERYMENVWKMFVLSLSGSGLNARGKQGHNNERLKFDDEKKINFFFSAVIVKINFHRV